MRLCGQPVDWLLMTGAESLPICAPSLCSFPHFPLPRPIPGSSVLRVVGEFGQEKAMADDWRVREGERLEYFSDFSVPVRSLTVATSRSLLLPPARPSVTVPAPWKSPSWVLAPGWPQLLCSDKTPPLVPPLQP